MKDHALNCLMMMNCGVWTIHETVRQMMLAGIDAMIVQALVHPLHNQEYEAALSLLS